jgi:DNA invertase Pin-like site-specific DNA recombinase
MNALGYSRVSTNGQAEDGFGLDIQQATIQGWADTHGATLLEVYRDEGVSGTLQERPALGAALQALAAGDVLVVPRLDRLARDLITQELLLREIRGRGAELVSCAEGEQAYLADTPDDPSRKMIRQVLGAVAEYERAMVALRLRGGRARLRAAGGYAGGEAPFGMRWEPGNGLVEDAREQVVLRAMRFGRSVGQTYEQIASALNERDMQPRRGKEWTKQAVHRILSRQTERGEMTG